MYVCNLLWYLLSADWLPGTLMVFDVFSRRFLTGADG